MKLLVTFAIQLKEINHVITYNRVNVHIKPKTNGDLRSVMYLQ